MRVVIIGAGVVGLATAHALLDSGHEVELLDPGEPGGATSRGNAGSIAHTDILPLASPKVIWQVMGWLADPLGPLAIRPSYLPQLLPWLARFLMASRPSEVERSTRAIIALSALALPAWERRLASLGLEREFVHAGSMTVFDSLKTFEATKPVFERQRSLGIPVDLLDGDGVRALEPVLAREFVAGAVFPSVARVRDPFELSTKLAAALRQRGGRFHGTAATAITEPAGNIRIRLDDGNEMTADAIVLAAGAWSRQLAAMAGDRVPLDTERGYNATMTAPNVSFTHCILFEGHGFVLSPLATGLRIGGAVELAGTEAPPNWKRVDALLAKARRFVPDLKEGGRVNWMGFRPSLPDSLPVISRARANPRIIHAFGHGHYGLTQAAATAELVAALVDGREPAIDLAPYSAQRF